MVLFSAVVLAAGLSTRMGRSKPLLPIGDSSLIAAIVTTLARSDLGEIIVVTGHEAEAVAGAVKGLPARPVFNPDYAEGEMISSVQTGLRASDPASRGALICLGDQPEISRRTLALLKRELEEMKDDAILLPAFEGRRGHPIAVPRSVWPAVLAVSLQGSLRDVIHDPEIMVRTVDVENDSILRDMDTPEDYRREIERRQRRSP